MSEMTSVSETLVQGSQGCVRAGGSVIWINTPPEDNRWEENREQREQEGRLHRKDSTPSL